MIVFVFYKYFLFNIENCYICMIFFDDNEDKVFNRYKLFLY